MSTLKVANCVIVSCVQVTESFELVKVAHKMATQVFGFVEDTLRRQLMLPCLTKQNNLSLSRQYIVVIFFMQLKCQHSE